MRRRLKFIETFGIIETFVINETIREDLAVLKVLPRSSSSSRRFEFIEKFIIIEAFVTFRRPTKVV